MATKCFYPGCENSAKDITEGYSGNTPNITIKELYSCKEHEEILSAALLMIAGSLKKAAKTAKTQKAAAQEFLDTMFR